MYHGVSVACNFNNRIDFIKNEAGKMIRGSVNGDASPDKYKYFFEKESGQALFSKLVFSVRKR